MNARNQCINIRVDARQIKDAVLCILDSTLLHRVVGKYKYNAQGSSFSTGSIGIEEVSLSQIDLTYVRVNSPGLVENVQRQVHDYINYLQLDTSFDDGYAYGLSERASSFNKCDSLITARLRLEFYQKKRRTWMTVVTEECLPWEIWNIEFDVIRTDDLSTMREEVGEKLGEIVLNICNIVNQPRLYIPSVPNLTDLPLVFDDTFSDVQPYLFRLVYNKEKGPLSVADAVKGYLKQTVSSLTY
uniref:Autophagy-related protein 101 n=1 Tax=Panagrolaimus sp. JU765 TaxID=591449 RepID=A0AC34QKH7_9BILA